MVEVYFDDLTLSAQKKVLEEAGITDPKEANWDIFPIATYEIEYTEPNPYAGMIEFVEGGEIHWA